MNTDKPVILVVEDEDIARRNLEHILVKEDWEVVSVNNCPKAIEQLKARQFDLVITDLMMEKGDGMEVLEECKKLQPYVEVIMITGYATVQSAVETMMKGAYSYIAKPYKINEVRKIASEGIIKRKLMLENLKLKELLNAPRQIPAIIGNSSPINEIKRTINQIATSDSNVLILGESGTGKELVAKAIHKLSDRAEKKLVAFNCGSFTEDLMASELFGHEKGAFSGAVKDKPGLLEVAEGGTVFLDEVGDMPVTMQIKLLRVIQEKEFIRVGGVETIPVDVRFIAATHRDLNEEVKQNRFRQDLFYRLNIIALHIPPLTKRNGDIQLLAYHFLKLKTDEMGKKITGIDQEAMDLMAQYDWPGNVRELENIIERAISLENGLKITVDGLPDYIRNLDIVTYRKSDSEIPTLEEQEINYIKWVLKKWDGNKTKAAEVMGIDRVSLWRKIKRHGIE